MLFSKMSNVIVVSY